jgi:hypothetical protein
MSQPESKPSMIGTIAFIVIGALIFIPSGLCTGVMLFGPVLELILHPQSGVPAYGFGTIALFVGGPFVAIGGALIWTGIRRLRERPIDSSNDLRYK